MKRNASRRRTRRSRPQLENPFDKVKAEDFNDDYALIAHLFARPRQVLYNKLVGRENYIIVGGWGSGKTHLLKYLALRSQIEDFGKAKVRKSNMICTYIQPKVGSGYFKPFVKPDGEFKEGGEVLFGHWFNLLVLENILNDILFGRNRGIWRITKEEEYLVSGRIISKLSGRNANIDPIKERHAQISLTLEETIDRIRDYRREIISYVNSRDLDKSLSQGAAMSTRPTDIKTFLDEAVRDLKGSIASRHLSPKRFYILLDECEVLSISQQKVINTIIKQRHTTLVFKLATRPPGLKTTDTVDKNVKLTDRECKLISLDSEYDPRSADFRKLCKSVASKRLERYGYSPTSINDILGRFTAEDEVGRAKLVSYLKKHYPSERIVHDPKKFPRTYKDYKDAAAYQITKAGKKYAGFETFVVLSSGIMSQFLELCREVIDRSLGKFVKREGDKIRITVVPIPHIVQHKSAEAVSGFFYNQSIKIRARSPEAFPEVEFGEKIQYVCKVLAGIFREKLMGFNAPEAARLEIPEGLQALRQTPKNPIRAIMKDAIRISVFQEGRSYMPKRIGGIKPSTYILNRILAPYFMISPHPRWRTTIGADTLSKILEVNEKEFRDLVIGRRTPEEKREEPTVEDGQLTLPSFVKVGESMPVLYHLTGRRKDAPFQGKHFLIALHFLRDLVPFLDCLERLGLSPSRSAVFYKDYMYPHKDEVVSLLRQRGYNVHSLHALDQILSEFDGLLEPGQLVVIEDGGYIVPKLHTTFKNLGKITLGAVEQTTRGIRNDRALGSLLFPVISIPASELKRTFEPSHVARAAVNNLQRLLPSVNFSGKQALVVGFGTIGEALALHLKEALNMRVTVCDSDETRLLKATQSGFDVERLLEKAVAGKAFILGATGERVIGVREILAMKHNVHLASVSSDQWEFAIEELATACSEKSDILSDESEKIGTKFKIRKTRNEINLLADGYPINFCRYESMPNEASDLIMSLVLLSAEKIALASDLLNEVNENIVNDLAEENKLSGIYLGYHR